MYCVVEHAERAQHPTRACFYVRVRSGLSLNCWLLYLFGSYTGFSLSLVYDHCLVYLVCASSGASGAHALSSCVCCIYIYIYIYIYREREREIHVCVYIYIYVLIS